jgi:hypothetical protein
LSPQGEATPPRILPIHEERGAGLLQGIELDVLLGRLLGYGNLSQGQLGQVRCRQPPMGSRGDARSASWAETGFPAPPPSQTMTGE